MEPPFTVFELNVRFSGDFGMVNGDLMVIGEFLGQN